LRVTPQEIGFNAATDFWLDVAEFESRYTLAERASSADQQAVLYSQAVSFYTADLLTDCYEEWCIQERERLQYMYLRALERLLSYHADRKHFEDAIECARRILACDSLRESVHRELIELYIAAGQSASALRQYRQCEDVLEREMAVAPMHETQALLTRILGDTQHRRPQTAIRIVSGDRGSLDLSDMARQLAESVSLVQQAAAACSEVYARMQELASLYQTQSQSEAA
jgi:DNA-binding SARP family transcriptional activator